MKNIYCALLIAFVPSGVLRAETILARCGPSIGESYYFEGGFVGPGQGGWKKDGFENGAVTAYLTNDNRIDLLVKDASGVKSYIKEGYKLNLLKVDPKERSFLIAVYGDGFTENYLFKTNESGLATLAWTASKITQAVTRTTIMTSECGPKFSIVP